MNITRRVYDCFLFYKELDLLEMRLNILDSVVDYFVLIESTRTFTGNPKPLFFSENRERFKIFLDRIIHVVVDEEPEECNTAWDREFFQRNAVMRGLKQCHADDLILLSDLDEIPNPALLQRINRITKPIRCQQLYCYYYLNYLNTTKPWWSGTRIVQRRHLDQWTSQEIRKLPRRYCNLLGNGGWHFSFLGDIRFITEKINDFSHQEFNNEMFNEPDKISEAIQTGSDLFGRDFAFRAFNPDVLLPAYILQNLDQYKGYLREPELSSAELKRILGTKGLPTFINRLKYKLNKHQRKTAKC
jgi:beta-1,4-mannosyl-glycoprotein beta-1,4-N-acetylglucosaminyltransferase